ncbi:DUF4136 domain-containing protein [Lacinutrix sp. Hel_I_90]|uniref:DUF4136 domain-containing protein n=1 Tax=Lacinutrix sp. Hel_I_90 TaxID=1249999 RepID=UPI0005CB3594|nr:DUF4136 domain-containing protein [Lacinutrix sp. Hel_I_90]
MKILKIVLLFLCVVSCAPIYVNYDYEKTTNFSDYKTYHFYDDMDTGFTGLDEKRFILALETKLNTMGLTKSETPDFVIDLKSNEYHEGQRNTVGVGLGGGNVGLSGGGVSIGIPMGQEKINREIIVEFVDDSKTGLFWQVRSVSSFNPNATPEKREAKLDAIVEKMFTEYPPKK